MLDRLEIARRKRRCVGNRREGADRPPEEGIESNAPTRYTWKREEGDPLRLALNPELCLPQSSREDEKELFVLDGDGGKMREIGVGECEISGGDGQEAMAGRGAKQEQRYSAQNT